MDLFEIAGAFGIITSILSFCNNAALASVCKYAMYAFWGAYVLMVILKGNFKFRPIIWYMLAVYGIMFAAGRFFYSTGQYLSSGAGPAKYLPLCAFFYFVGYNKQNDGRREMHIFVKAYLYAHIVFVILKLIFLRTAEDDSIAKNQSAQVVGLGIVLALYVLPLYEQRKWMRWAFLAFAAFSFAVLIQLHSRTPVLAVLIVTAFWLFSRPQKKQYILLAILVIVLCIVYFNTERGSNMLFEYLQGDKRQDELTWYSITSGRTDQYEEVLREIVMHPLIGQGAWAYLDSFPLHILWTGGLLAAVLVLPVAYGRILHYTAAGFREGRLLEESRQDHMIRAASLISVFYFVVSLFEGYPPLGPGASSFMLWIVIGMADRGRFEETSDRAISEGRT